MRKSSWDNRDVNGWHYVGIYHLPPPKPYQPGDLVDLPDTEEVRVWKNDLAASVVPKKVLTVIDAGCLFVEVTDKEGNHHAVPNHLLIPHIPTEAEADEPKPRFIADYSDARIDIDGKSIQLTKLEEA